MDIDKQLKENIMGEMLLLPKKTREVINAFEFQKIFVEIGKNHKLIEEEVKKLEIETILVLIGLVNPLLYSQNIENNIGMSEQESKEVEKEITSQIFQPIYEKIVEKIKNSPTYYNPKWKQSVNFIVSGGDYSVFVEETENMNNKKVEYREVI